MPASPGEDLRNSEVRSRLQPVYFMKLSQGLDHKYFREGATVAVQYWGTGDVRVTSCQYPSHTTVVIASQLHGTWAAWTGDTEVPDGY